ncbi:uncharacterized protein G2W53_014743 [Senna tora]|uniref:Uncharacterized protein n=1 Tax=Senna tora TaxID=362788 RepID=A0A835C697_9FABA|nr:uncharacterized protein G2W53_014743 [Senna tora]
MLPSSGLSFTTINDHRWLTADQATAISNTLCFHNASSFFSLRDETTNSWWSEV